MISPQSGSTLGFPRGYVDYEIIVSLFGADVNIQMLGCFPRWKLSYFKVVYKDMSEHDFEKIKYLYSLFFRFLCRLHLL